MRGFKRYLAAALAGRFASEGMGIALVLLALERTGRASDGAFVLTAWLAPHVLAAPLAGAVAARTARPRLLHAGALAGFALAVAALSVLVGRAPLPVVIAVAVAGGGCGPMVTGGLSSLVATLVPAGAGRDQAYAWDAATYNAAGVTAPAVVSLIAALGSAGPAMAVLACSGALAAVLAALLPYEDQRTRPRAAGPRPGAGGGFAALWRVRELRAVTASTTLAFVGLGALSTTSVLLTRSLGAPGAGGALMTAFAVGALSGSLLLARRRAAGRAGDPGRLARWSLAGTGVALAGAAFAPTVPLAVGCFALAGLCDGPLLTATLRIRAEHAPEAVRAQVFTLGAGLKITAAAAGAALVGLAAARPPWTLLLGIAALQLAAAALHRLTTGPRAPAAPSTTAPAPRQDA
ncbi:MFS transporter [Streptomyces sp. G-G2]|uniref:MFS transporter n=1 Tax=Streptomyces sp. G-G2 TaxID=3046201 RepID=UPI0024B8D47C|nr:MFS transporter [Streptomyces sp. G-G2]MDJ0381179.1 MFS transporter [Streptomyces sp. G-G2]